MTLKLGLQNGRVNVGSLLENGVFKDLITSSLNENFGIIIQELTPLIERFVAKTAKKLANMVMSIYTEEQLFT